MYSSVEACCFMALRNKLEEFDALAGFTFIGDSILIGSTEVNLLSYTGSFLFYVKEDVFSSI